MTRRKLEEGMRRCIRLARDAALSGNYGVGAVVLRNGTVIGESGSGLVEGSDPTGHPETQAIRMAAERVGSRHLPDAFLLTTLEPCPMCTSAAIWAKMRGIAFGATQHDARQWAAEHPGDTFTWRRIDIRAQDVVRAGHPRLEVHEEACRARRDAVGGGAKTG